MSGHQHKAQSRGANPPAAPASDHRLDQFAAAVADARTSNPAVAAFATQEDQFIDAAMDIGAHLDRQTLGAAWLIASQVMSSHLATVPPEQQAGALAMLLNVIKLAGERLYTGNGLPMTVACPFTYTGGTACSTTYTAPNRERIDLLFRAHVWQNHPGEQWPPTEPERPEPRANQYVVGGGPAVPTEDDLFPPTSLGPNPTFDELKRYANIRVLAMTALGFDRRDGDPISGRKGELTPQAAWEQAEKDYDLLLSDAIVIAGGDVAELVAQEGTVSCACGKPAELIRGITNGPNGEPGEAQALCLDCAKRDMLGD